MTYGELMSEPSSRALEVFSEHLRRLEIGQESDLAELCSEHAGLAEELRQLYAEWARMSEVLDRLGPKEGTLSLQLRERYGDSVDPEISLSGLEEEGEQKESSSTLMSKLSSQGGSERYKARDEIARGGMGAILRVWDEDLRRPLAMKVALRGDGETKGAASDEHSQRRLSRFLEEAQITSQLDHPGIVPVHDLGIDPEGRVYFTMQLVDGRDMRDIIALAERGEEGWDLKRVVGVLIRVCEALAYAHDKDVVHRDVKPGNVMVGKFGEVFLMDWGLAKVMGREEEVSGADSSMIHTLRSDGSSAEHTLAGDVVGTPAFMAPEQALGRSDEVGPGSDIYAVGAMLYFALSGQLPYQPLGESVSALTILEAVKSGPPWSVKKINPEAPPELIAICEKAMARERSERFGDAMALGEELRNWLEGHAVATYETGVIYSVRKWVGRNKGMASTLMGMVLLVVGGLGLLFQQQQQSILDLEEEQLLTKAAQAAAEANAEQAEEEAERAKEAERRASEQSNRLLTEQIKVNSLEEERLQTLEEARRARYRAQVTAAWYSLRLSEAGRTRQRLEGADRDLRGWEWRHLELGAEDSVMTPLPHPNGSVDLAFNGEDIVSMGADAVARLYDTVDWSFEDHAVRYGLPNIGAQGITAQVGTGKNLCALSSGGILATASQSPVVLLWDMESLDVIRPLTGGAQRRGSSAQITDLAFSADGLLLGTVDSAGLARVRSVPDGEVLWEQDVDDPLTCLAFHPSRAQVALGTKGGRVELWDFLSRERLGGFVDEGRSVINALLYSHDGEILASAQEDGEVQLWETSVLLSQERAEGDGFIIQGLNIFLEWAKLKPKYRLVGHRLGVTCLVFSWDDRSIYAGGRDGTVRAWSAVHGASAGVMHGHEAAVLGLCSLPGERLLSGAEDGTLRVFDPYWEETRQPLGDSAGSRVLFVGERAAEEGASALALSAGGVLMRERTSSGNTRAPLRPRAGSWAAAARLGDLYLALSDGGSQVYVIDPETGGLVEALAGHDARVVDLAADEMGYRLISGSSDSRAIIWEGLESGEEVDSWSIPHARAVVAVGINADGTRVVTADKDKDLRVWDADLREEVDRWPAAHTWQVQALGISLDGEQVASSSKDVVLIHRVGEEGLVSQLGPHQADVSAVCFHADGERLFSGDVLGNIYLWDVESGDALLELAGHDEAVTALAMSVDAHTLWSGDDGGLVYAWRSTKDSQRHKHFEDGARRELREASLLRFFDGDEALAHERLIAGFRGLSDSDPVVASFLARVAASGAALERDDE